MIHMCISFSEKEPVLRRTMIETFNLIACLANYLRSNTGASSSDSTILQVSEGVSTTPVLMLMQVEKELKAIAFKRV